MGKKEQGLCHPAPTPAAQPTLLFLFPLPQPVTHLCSHSFRQLWGGVEMSDERDTLLGDKGLYFELNFFKKGIKDP